FLARAGAERRRLPCRADHDVRSGSAAAGPVVPIPPDRASGRAGRVRQRRARASLDRRARLRARQRDRDRRHLRVRQHLLDRRGPAQFPGDARRLRRRGGPQMSSHLLLLVIFALLVSAVFAALARDEPREQLRTGAMMFGGFIAAAIVLGWLMYTLPL